MKQHLVAIQIATASELSAEAVADLVTQIIQHGQQHVTGKSLISAAGLEIGKVAPLNAIDAPVKHWGAYEVQGTVDTHRMLTELSGSGQVRATLYSLDEAREDETIAAMVEVNTDPINGVDHLPCVHVSFDDDENAVSMFKHGNRILVRPDTGVTLDPAGKGMYWLSGVNRG
jgi:hypothetical protein